MSGRLVVIGAGADELVAALYLARAGHRVTVLEEHASDSMPAPPSEGWILPRIAADLELERHGLCVERPDPWIETVLPGGERLQLWRDTQRSEDSLRKCSALDAAQWPRFCARLRSVAGVLEQLYTAPAPDPMSRDAADLWQLASLSWRVRRLGRCAIQDLLHVLPMPVADLLDDSFELDALKATLATAGVMHSFLGPRSAGSALGLVHRHVGNPSGVFRPERSNLPAVLRGLVERQPRIELRRDRVAGIDIRSGRARGVRTASGALLEADAVVSGLDPRRTLLELVDPVWIDPELQRALRHVRARGVSATVHLRLSGAATFRRLSFAASLDALERSFDDAKYGRMSSTPLVEAVSESEQGVSVHVQYIPYALRDGAWGEKRRHALGLSVLSQLAARAPEFAHARIERVATPLDLESALGWPQGQAQHAELALDQFLWMRPLPQLARYATPVAGLYLCGPAMHPGAGVPGAAGMLAAAALR